MIISILCMFLVIPQFVVSIPVPDPTTESLVIVTPGVERTTSEENTEDESSTYPKLKKMEVVANIQNRYARTVVQTSYMNPRDTAEEATFSIVLPKKAFISGFMMQIKDKKYEAYVREKEEAKREYDRAVEQGIGAAHVAASARDSNSFTVSMNVEPHGKVIFNLTYEQLLERKHGLYDMVINLNPRQFVKDLSVVVNIKELIPIRDINVIDLRSGNEITDQVTGNEITTIQKLNSDETEIQARFAPTVEQQKILMKKLKKNEKNEEFAGQFVVQYDVDRDSESGEVIIDNGYFVHFFSPKELKPIPKHVVFVLDVSGSMHGSKIQQLREAMKVILGELHENDHFNVVKFDTTVHVLDDTWKIVSNPEESPLPEPVPASSENIRKAQDIIEKMQHEELTNINDALTVALRLTSKEIVKGEHIDAEHKPQPIIIFLTDGLTNVGETNPTKMMENIESRNRKQTFIYTLSFGNYANDEFLKNLAEKNLGFWRKIYEEADAEIQLEDFYKLISSPLLTNVTYKFVNDQVKDTTKSDFNIFFKGSEVVVAGRIANQTEKFMSIEAETVNGHKIFHPKMFQIIRKPEIKQEYGSLERLWVYLTIQQLLKEHKDSATSKKKALDLALKYSFVTPVSSLVVIKPNSTESVSTKDAKATSQINRNYNVARSGFSSAMGQSIRPLFSNYPASTYNLMSLQPRTSIRMKPIQILQHKLSSSSFSNIQSVNPSWQELLSGSTSSYEIDNKLYLVGNNQTTYSPEPCRVQSLNLDGQCTLLSACPKIHHKLDSFITYRSNYFCTLNSDEYMGVCCVDAN